MGKVSRLYTSPSCDAGRTNCLRIDVQLQGPESMPGFVLALHAVQFPIWYVSSGLPRRSASSEPHLTLTRRFLRLPIDPWIPLQHALEHVRERNTLSLQHRLVLYHCCVRDVPGWGGCHRTVRILSSSGRSYEPLGVTMASRWILYSQNCSNPAIQT